MKREYDGITCRQELIYKAVRWVAQQFGKVDSALSMWAYGYMDLVCKCEKCQARQRRSEEGAGI